MGTVIDFSTRQRKHLYLPTRAGDPLSFAAFNLGIELSDMENFQDSCYKEDSEEIYIDNDKTLDLGR